MYAYSVKLIWITGSSGFLGSEISKIAVESGYHVLGIDIKPGLDSPKKNFSFRRGNITEISLDEIEKPEVIIHTASSLPYGNSKEEFAVNNILAAQKIAMFAKRSDSFLVEIGSSSVYGKPSQIPINPNTPLKPLDLYAKSKLQAEIEIANVLTPNKFAVIRPRTILGKGRGGIFEIFFSLIRRQIPIPLPNGGRQIIQFAHVQDLARLSLYIGEHRISGVWPAASPNPKPLREHLKELQEVANIPIRYVGLNAKLFYSFGLVAYRAHLTKFTPWHFGAFPFDNFFEENWSPENFEYRHTSSQAFLETWDAKKSEEGRKLPFLSQIGRLV
jgi:nucleoside-diphosphate-sugar epimerase